MKGVPQGKTIDAMIEGELSKAESRIHYHEGKLLDRPRKQTYELHKKSLNDEKKRQEQLLNLLNEIRSLDRRKYVDIYAELKEMTRTI